MLPLHASDELLAELRSSLSSSLCTEMAEEGFGESCAEQSLPGPESFSISQAPGTGLVKLCPLAESDTPIGETMLECPGHLAPHPWEVFYP